MTEILKNEFESRKMKVLEIIDKYAKEFNQSWEDIGIFGSYARGTANGSSDIDFCIISEKPDSLIFANLREEADALGADIIFIIKESLIKQESLLSRNIKKDLVFIKGVGCLKNDYYDIAYNDLLYLEEDFHKKNYNPMVVQIQQIAEKMLKSVLELICVDIESLLRSNNLRQIYTAIREKLDYFDLNEMELGYLKDFYFEAKYPGDNFIVVSREQCSTCLHIMYKIIQQVNSFRKKNNLNVYEVDEKFLESTNKIKSFS